MLRQVCPLGRSRYRYFAREVLTIPKKQEKMTQKPDVPSKYEFLHTLAKPEARDAGKVFFFRPGQEARDRAKAGLLLLLGRRRTTTNHLHRQLLKRASNKYSLGSQIFGIFCHCHCMSHGVEHQSRLVMLKALSDWSRPATLKPIKKASSSVQALSAHQRTSQDKMLLLTPCPFLPFL